MGSKYFILMIDICLVMLGMLTSANYLYRNAGSLAPSRHGSTLLLYSISELFNEQI